MISGDSNPFLNAEQQKNDTMTKSWDKFAETNAEINAENVEDSNKKQIIQGEEKSSNFAVEAHKGHDTHSSCLDP